MTSPLREICHPLPPVAVPAATPRPPPRLARSSARVATILVPVAAERRLSRGTAFLGARLSDWYAGFARSRVGESLPGA